MRNKGNAKHGVSPRLKIKPCDLDLWPWKSIWFQIVLRSKYVPSLVKIHWRMLILECSQGCYAVKIWPLDLWLWKSIGFHSPKDYVCTKFGQNPLKDVDSRVFTKMLHGKKFTQWPWPLTLKINRVLDSPKYVPSLVKIQWRMLILECSQGCYVVKIWPWPSPLTLKINRVPDSLKDYICTKFGQNPLKDVDPRVFTRIVTDGRKVALLYPLATSLARG